MRLLLFIAAASVLVGCRSTQIAYHAKVCNASNCCGPNAVVLTTNASETSSFSIEELVQLGLASNPSIEEAKQTICSLKQRIPQELSLPDPMVNTATHLAPVETAAGQQAFALGVSQKFVNLNRRATKAAMANDEVCAAKANLLRLQQQIAEQIRVACFQLLAIQETIQITKDDVEILKQIEEVVIRQYEVKQAVSQQDVLNIQIEQSKVENQLTDLLQKEKTYSARVSRLVHFEPGMSIVLQDGLGDVAQQQDVDSLIAQALASRPELAGQLARIRKERRKICLANLQNRPDYTVGLNWIATSTNGISPVANGDDAVLLGIGFNLPVYKNRIRAAACEAKHSSLASQAKLASLQDQIAEEVFDSVARLDSTASTISLLREDIIPKSERTLQIAIEDYSNGNTDYAQLITNWRSLLQYRIAEANLQSERMQLLASLGRQLGLIEPVENMGGLTSLPGLPPNEKEVIVGQDMPKTIENPSTETHQSIKQ